jgi:hypothetical protein
MVTAPTLDYAQLTAVYVKIRDRRAEIKRTYEAEDDALKAQLATIEGHLLGHLNATGSESVRTDAGTFYRQEEVKPNITDDIVFYDFVQANALAGEALERRVKVGFVKEFMAAHDGLPPPGVSVSREHVVRVRKAG